MNSEEMFLQLLRDGVKLKSTWQGDHVEAVFPDGHIEKFNVSPETWKTLANGMPPFLQQPPPNFLE